MAPLDEIRSHLFVFIDCRSAQNECSVCGESQELNIAAHAYTYFENDSRFRLLLQECVAVSTIAR